MEHRRLSGEGLGAERPKGPGGEALRFETELRPLTLRFSDAAVEAEFLADYARRFLSHMRTALLLGLALYAAFGALDPYLIPDTTRFAWTLRYAVVCPLFLVGYLASGLAGFRRVAQPVVSGLSFVAGVGIVAMIARAAPPGSHLYYAGLMLVCTYVYTFFRLRLVWAAPSALGIVALYEFVAARDPQLPAAVLVSNTVFLAAIHVIGASACYAMERAVRVDFLRKRVVARQAEDLRRALADVKVLTDLLPICAWCKNVRDDQGYWRQIEEYLATRGGATLSHGICPECLDKVRSGAAEGA